MQLMAAFTQMATRAHAHGIKVLGATLTPYVGSDYYHPEAVSEADRVKLNEWIRHSGTFDGVVDFDEALRDPAHPDRLLPEFDSGDHLHPGPAGYKRMGEAVPLRLLQ
jgi:lysophospholipase L1-like esterase